MYMLHTPVLQPSASFLGGGKGVVDLAILRSDAPLCFQGSPLVALWEAYKMPRIEHKLTVQGKCSTGCTTSLLGILLK